MVNTEGYSMPRRGESIYKRKDGRWEGRYIVSYKPDGKAIYKSVYGKSYSETKEKMQRFKSNTVKFPPCNVKFSDLCTQWLEDIKISLKQSAYAQYDNSVHKHIIPYFGNIKVKTISKDMVNGFIKNKLEKGRLDGKGGLSPKTVIDLWSKLNAIIHYAESKGYIQDFDYDVIQPKTVDNELPILTVQEQIKLITSIKSNLTTEKLGILLSLYAGIRLGEVCALTWENIDFDNGMLKIRTTLQRIKNTDKNAKTKTKVVIDTPKSKKSIRDIPLPNFLIGTLKSFVSENERAYVLTGTQKYMENRVYQNRFKQYLFEAQIDDINFHALRHTFATRAIENGIDIKSLSEILGHASVRFTLERYVHSSNSLKKQGMEKLAICY